MCVAAVAGDVSFNDDLVETCCKQQFGTAVYCNVKGNDINADCESSLSTAGSANNFELLAGPSRCAADVQSSSPQKCLSSDADSKLQENSVETVKCWQRSRSVIMMILGFVVRACFSSLFLTPVVQVTCQACRVCCSYPSYLFGRPYYRSRLWHTVSSVCLSSVTFCIQAKRLDRFA